MKLILMVVFLTISFFGISQDNTIHKIESGKVEMTNANNKDEHHILNEYSLITIDFSKNMIMISPIHTTLDIVGDDETVHKGIDEIVTYLCKDEKNEDCKFSLFYRNHRLVLIELDYSSIELTFTLLTERS